MKVFQHARRRLMITALAACGAMTLGATTAHAQGSPGVTDKEVKIGAWIPLTGPIAVVGVPQKAGFEAYINMINDRGGVNGRKITWVVEDNAYNPQRTAAAARKLVTRDEVLAIVHANGTAQSLAAFPYLLDEAKVPFFFAYAGLKDWWYPPRQDLYGLFVNLENQARLLGRWAAKEGAKNVIVVHSALMQFEAVAKEVIPGVKSVAQTSNVELYAAKFDTQDYGPIAIDIGKKKPDAIVYILAQGDIVRLAKELAQQGVKVPTYTYAPTVANSFIQLGGPAVQGLRSMSLTLPPEADTPAMREYKEALAKYFPNEKPDYISLFGFANAKVFVEGLRRVKGPLTRQSLKEGIESLKNYDSGILAPVTFAADRHLGMTATQRVQLTGNRWVPVGTPVDGDKDW
jgi:branched-chain amino acid transport system substrate-binding protein